MKKVFIFAMSLIMMVVASSEFTYARSDSRGNDKGQSSSHNNSKPQSNSKPQTYRKGDSHPAGSYNKRPVTYERYSKPKVVNKLPPSKYPIRHNGVDYYRNGSKYYKRVNDRYILSPLPFGIRIPIIPPIHSIFRFNNLMYYIAEGIIYQETSNNQYMVVEPQPGMVIPELPMINVSQVNIDGMIYFEHDGILYKQIPTVTGLQYEVIGSLYN
ncbi:MAG: DUF6515 family protein [Rikenellaceae bacterium]